VPPASGGGPQIVELGSWRLVLPGTTAPPLGDVYLEEVAGYEWDGHVDPLPGESAEETLWRYLRKRAELD
jgi:hypothetical protein